MSGYISLIINLYKLLHVSATVSEHTMLLEGTGTRPPPAGVSSGPVTGAEIMRKLSKSHTHSDSALKIKVKMLNCKSGERWIDEYLSGVQLDQTSGYRIMKS